MKRLILTLAATVFFSLPFSASEPLQKTEKPAEAKESVSSNDNPGPSDGTESEKNSENENPDENEKPKPNFLETILEQKKIESKMSQ